MPPSSDNRALAARVLPFAVFLAFIGLGEVLRLAPDAIHWLPGPMEAWLYPPRVLAAAWLLVHFRSLYPELRWAELKNPRLFCGSLLAGLIVYLLWVNMDWSWAVIGQAQGFDPARIENTALRSGFLLLRVAGAVIVVPLIEELFWRSFLPRYLDGRDFMAIPLGAFTPFSFIASALLFGLEHHLFVAGIMAGVAYNLLLARTRSLTACVLAHAVTNAALACHVLLTNSWRFW